MRAILALAALVALATPVLAGNHALVIANAAYRDLAALPTPYADAALVAAGLEGRGFSVTRHEDLDRAGFRDALRAFRDQADAGDVVAVYFSGYGVSTNDKSYLVPIDADLADARDAEWDLIAVEDVLRQIAGAKVMRAVFLDASRPLGAALAPESGYLAGLSPVIDAPPVTLVGYGAAPGTVRPDPAGALNAPYSAALGAVLAQPIANPLTLMQEARAGTQAAVPGAQPYLFDNISAPSQPGGAQPAVTARPPLPEAEAKRELQRQLKTRKCYFGGIDGIWGGGSVRGMEAFLRQADVTFPVDRAMDERQLNAALAVMDAHPDVTCPPRKRSSPRRGTTRKRSSDAPRFCPDYGSHAGCPDNY